MGAVDRRLVLSPEAGRGARLRELAAAFPDRARGLQRLLAEWRRSVGAPVPTQKNPKYDPNAPVVMEGEGQPVD